MHGILTDSRRKRFLTKSFYYSGSSKNSCLFTKHFSAAANCFQFAMQKIRVDKQCIIILMIIIILLIRRCTKISVFARTVRCMEKAWKRTINRRLQPDLLKILHSQTYQPLKPETISYTYSLLFADIFPGRFKTDTISFRISTGKYCNCFRTHLVQMACSIQLIVRNIFTKPV